MKMNSPLLNAFVGDMAMGEAQRMMGFWLLWHSAGGAKEIQERRFLSRAQVYRNRALFLAIFKNDVSEMWPELAAEVRKYEKKKNLEEKKKAYEQAEKLATE